MRFVCSNEVSSRGCVFIATVTYNLIIETIESDPFLDGDLVDFPKLSETPLGLLSCNRWSSDIITTPVIDNQITGYINLSDLSPKRTFLAPQFPLFYRS